ncbi:MAG: hypothetical protein KAI55_01320 [Candidatus Aenigmarchaeota archaeon]|nr:hypothetical protein [Candidatus Aenigmarchaeota archaeon]
MKRYILIGIIVVVVMIGLCYFLLNQQQNNQEDIDVAEDRICITEPGKAYYPPKEKCCNELKSIFGPDVSPEECKLLTEHGGGAPICALCGNGICESKYGENKCSCPEDCK